MRYTRAVSMPVDMARGGAHVDVISVRLAFGERRVSTVSRAASRKAKISVILGASGVGKSTLLRLIAGLQRPDYGDIWIGEQEISRMPGAPDAQYGGASA